MAETSKSDVCDVEQDNWRTISHKKSTRIRRNSNRPEPIRGINSDKEAGELPVAEKMAFLFLSGLGPNVVPEDVLSYLAKRGLQDGCSCDKIVTKKSKYISSFKLAVPKNKREKYLNAETWPSGVWVNHFLKMQRQRMVNKENPPHPTENQRL